MSTPLRVLIVEDSEEDAALLLHELKRGGYDTVSERVSTLKEMRSALNRKWDIILLGCSLMHLDVPTALALLKEKGLSVPLIVVSSRASEELAVAAMKAGAQDYIVKHNLARLIPAIGRELRQAEGRREHKRAEEDALRQSEEQLRQSQKMEAIGRLAGGISHDFNNLLTAIIGYSEFLLFRLDQEDPLRKYAEEIKKAGERASSLTRQLLAFSRKQVLQPEVLDLNIIVADLDNMLRRLIGEDIELVTLLEPDLGAVKVDPGQMEQVIMNLAVNARDAMPYGGKLIIETANVDLDELYARQHSPIRPGHYVMLAVSDNGCGMDKETLSHIFEPFFTTKEQGKGTGLGLSTVYGIVKQSEGFIWVYSEPGTGTTFKIYLPQVQGAERWPKTSPLTTRMQRGSETILLVEDEEVVRELVGKLLPVNGFTVLAARNGSEALAICQQHKGPIHLLLTDVVMPQMSGRQLAAHLSKLHPEMKVLYMSGYTDDAIIRHGVLEPGLAFIQKPFTIDTMIQKVREVLDSPVECLVSGTGQVVADKGR